MYPSVLSIYNVVLPVDFLIDTMLFPNKELDEQKVHVIGQTLTHYRDSLWSNPKVLEVLEKIFGLKNLEILKALRAGYSDRTLTKLFPKRGTLEGESLRGTLVEESLLKASGNEAFRWQLVVELQNMLGKPVGLSGFSIHKAKKHKPSAHVLFSNANMGLINPYGLRKRCAILCNETKDVLHHLNEGRNAVGLMGVMDSEDEFIEVLKNSDIRSAIIQHSNTPMGEYWAKELTKALVGLDIEVKPNEA